MTYTYALCPFTPDKTGVFRGPVPEYSAIDLRSAELAASSGLGLFRIPGTPRLGNDCYVFGYAGAMSDIKLTPRVADRLGTGVQGDTLAQALVSRLTEMSAPDGDGRVKSLMPNCRGRLKVVLGGEVVLDRKMTVADPHYGKVVDVSRASIQQLADEGSLTYRKYLDDLRIKLRLTDEQVRAVWDQDSPLPRETSYGDDFNRADESLPASNWSILANMSAAIISNQLVVTSNGNLKPACRYDSDLSSDDQSGTVSFTATDSGNNGQGPALRFHATDETCYFGFWRLGSYQAAIYKKIAGSDTQLATTSAHNPNITGLPKVLTFEADGSALDLSEAVEGPLISTTDTSIIGNVRCGVGGTSSFGQTATVDNWSCEDLGGGPTFLDNTNNILRHILC